MNVLATFACAVTMETRLRGGGRGHLSRLSAILRWSRALAASRACSGSCDGSVRMFVVLLSSRRDERTPEKNKSRDIMLMRELAPSGVARA